MASECRANDPSSCRVHGTPDTGQGLKKIAENAADMGNMALYLSTRLKMDSIAVSSSVSSPTIPAKAVDAAAKSGWDFNDGFPEWENLASGVKEHHLKQALGSLEAAQRDMPFGVITDLAVEETAKYNWEYRDSQHSWDVTASKRHKNQYRLEARSALEAAAPHMPKHNQHITETLNRVLGYTYKGPRFDGSAAMISEFASVLDDADRAVVKEEGSASPAAEHIRSRLLDRFSSNGVSGASGATTALFSELGREKELGWIKEQAPGYRHNWKTKK